MNKNLIGLKQQILNECQTDYVELWSIVRTGQQYFPDLSNFELKNIVVDIINDLWWSHKIHASWTWNFSEANLLEPHEFENIINEKWTKNRLPNIGDGLIFTTI